MGDHRTTASVTGALLALILLTGCATESGPASGGPSTSSAQTGTTTREPTGAAGTYAPSGDGAGPGADSPSQYGLNKRHHDRTDLSAESAAALDVARAQVVREVAAEPTPVLQPAIEGILDGVGAPNRWIVTTQTGEKVLFEAQVEMSGCLIGEVQRDGTPEVTTAGWVLDGGCHALDGH
ncbi:hypothetical protein EDF42_2473 [Curtobacterium sp. PhB172]|uniref:hypothetical protein n=1 Tax=unclassified Curtobacterium TaxID=257496 RepID=UPI000FAE7573|nr:MULTISPECIES: hypothetical protein [unclassified Curtobacterium]ROQ07237.1 hypothetical protein EDF41_2501 [Curtobacterium sp. PhB171]ROQ28163.1 hypothetical protein EDF40_1293 [Curtobacterium sp. PhB170]ROS35093.1 hypothetical protein EDF25_2325 [Curtobacterium sp. PhB131]ROS64211.1 hypothetical protein EDF42_2473 [Curtobacterium sp. PhB172]ROS72540.1 hypothetical protein EDF30_0471 [Curtobacterium sp. PhB141]